MITQRHTTNPTGIREIPKANVGLRIDRDALGVIDRLTLERLDLSDLELVSDARISIVAKAHYTELTFDAGTVGMRKPIVDVSLEACDNSHPLYIRVIVFDDESKKVVASCEGLSVYESEESTLQSLLPVEPVDLGQILWRLAASSEDRPILQVNSDPQLSMLDCIRNNAFVQALVLPAAIQQALEHLLRNPAPDEDLAGWQNRWARYLEGLGIDLLNPEESEGAERVIWINAAVDAIATHLKLRTRAVDASPGVTEQ